VLDAKIRELKREVEPRELEVTALRSQIGAVNGELATYHGANAARDAAIGAMRGEIDALRRSTVADAAALKEGEKRLRAFEVALFGEVQGAASTGDWLGAAARTAAAGGGGARGAPESLVDLGFVAESLRQQAFLAADLARLRAEGAAAKAGAAGGAPAGGADARETVAENAALISQIASLAETTEAMRAETKALRLRAAQRAGAQAGAAGTGHRAVAAAKRGT